MTAWTLKLQQFQGPLDMLLHMVGQAKIDIRDIFVSEITDQYIRYVREAETLDMEHASAFIEMAATLLEIKSRAMLPKPPADEDDEDPRELLVRRLEEYAVIKRIAADMQGFEQAALKMYEKLPEEYPLPPPSLEITGLTMERLLEAFADVLARIPPEGRGTAEVAVRQISLDEHTVPDCMRRITGRLKKGSVQFSVLLSEQVTRDEVVALFLALLELLRLGKATVVQEQIYGDILLMPRGRGKDTHAGA